jgi:hypothetical protein
MTVEQRLEQVEQQNQKMQRTNKRLTVALTMVAMAWSVSIQLRPKKMDLPTAWSI